MIREAPLQLGLDRTGKDKYRKLGVASLSALFTQIEDRSRINDKSKRESGLRANSRTGGKR
jgi:hypothetical protein